MSELNPISMNVLAFVSLTVLLGLNHCDCLEYPQLPIRFRRPLIQYTNPYIRNKGDENFKVGTLARTCAFSPSNLTQLNPG